MFIREEAAYSQSQGLSATHLAVSSDGSPIGFITLTMGTVRFEAHERPRAASLSTLPALLVAQLGVAASYQGKGIGARLLRFAIGIAQSMHHSIGCRYLAVDCLPPLVPYYQRLGFSESKGEKRRRKADMQVTGRPQEQVAVRLAMDVFQDRWYEAEHAPPHLVATEVHRAAVSGDMALLESLLKAGVPADLRSGRGDDGLGWGATALHVAASRAQVGAIRVLLASGADVDALDGDLETPLHWCRRISKFPHP